MNRSELLSTLERQVEQLGLRPIDASEVKLRLRLSRTEVLRRIQATRCIELAAKMATESRKHEGLAG